MFSKEYWERMGQIVETAIQAQRDKNPEPMNIKELSRYLKCSEQTIYRYTSKRKIPFTKKMGTLYFNKNEIDKWLVSEKPKTAKELGIEADNYISKNPIAL